MTNAKVSISLMILIVLGYCEQYYVIFCWSSKPIRGAGTKQAMKSSYGHKSITILCYILFEILFFALLP